MIDQRELFIKSLTKTFFELKYLQEKHNAQLVIVLIFNYHSNEDFILSSSGTEILPWSYYWDLLAHLPKFIAIEFLNRSRTRSRLADLTEKDRLKDLTLTEEQQMVRLDFALLGEDSM